MSIPLKDLISHIRRLQIVTTRKVNNLFAGAYRSAFKGVGIEFEDVKEYKPGDEIRNIDWNLTARMQRPYVKNFREERELTVMLVVDISSSSRFGSRERFKSEIIAEIGAILAFSAIKNHDKVGLILFSDQIELYLKPKKGTRHVLRVIRELLYFTPKGKGTAIQKALSFYGKLQRKHTICFLISDFLDINFEKQASLIAKRHDLIFLEVFDKHEIAFPQIGLIQLKDLENGKLDWVDSSDPKVQTLFQEKSKENKKKLIKLIRKIGAAHIPIQTDESYINALRRFFKLRRLR